MIHPQTTGKSPLNLDYSNDKNADYYGGVRHDMLKYIPPAARTCLELGCGAGRFSELVKATFGAETWAVEISEQAAAQAATRLDKVLHGDATQAMDRLPDRYFDCVIAFDILEHLLGPAALLDAVKAKLRPGGVVVASIPNVRYYRVLADLVVHGDWEYKEHGILDNTHLRFFTRKSIVRMFDSLGYRIQQIEGIHPTSSRTFRMLNACLLTFLADARYKHFAVVASLPTE
ncbi:MAG TPA: class I SAM-dependent methyltransferase [Phycisphaerales bacterium]|nr:class I SAM-dependent methyltransferase [Phycisphaerales bacterium]